MKYMLLNSRETHDSLVNNIILLMSMNIQLQASILLVVFVFYIL
jgi:hypothetical protein